MPFTITYITPSDTATLTMESIEMLTDWLPASDGVVIFEKAGSVAQLSRNDPQMDISTFTTFTPEMSKSTHSHVDADAAFLAAVKGWM